MMHVASRLPDLALPSIWMCTAALLCLAGCPPPVVPPLDPPPPFPLIIGMEYALPGMANPLVQNGLPAVKPLPEQFAWDAMQPEPGAPIDFRVMDRVIREFQGAGSYFIMLGLIHRNAWASIDAGSPPLSLGTNFAPKPEFEDAYSGWIRAVVERYDLDGVDDMDGLRAPVNHIEIGVEFSSFEPGPVDDYLRTLALAYAAAHAANPSVVVAHVAFFPAFVCPDDPTPEAIEAAFANTPERVFIHTLDDWYAILDRPDVFDAVNFHALMAPYEVPRVVRWLRREMAARGYDRPILISDTLPSSFGGFGPLTVCDRPPQLMGILVPPATEADRCRLAQHFTRLVQGDLDTLAWTHAFVTADAVKRVVLAADAGVEFINTAFMADFPFLYPGAMAGNSAWAGMADFQVNVLTNTYTATTLRPLFYGLRQLAGHLREHPSLEQVDTSDPDTYLFRVAANATGTRPDFWIAWHEPEVLYLPEDIEPDAILEFPSDAGSVRVETLITAQGETEPTVADLPAVGGAVQVKLSPIPVFIFELD